MADGTGPWIVFDEPPAEDFEASTEGEAEAGARAVLVRILRTLAALLVIVALLVYLVSPFGNFFFTVPYHWLHPDSGTRPIPLAPQPEHSPKLPV